MKMFFNFPHLLEESVTPAKAGVQVLNILFNKKFTTWIPAFAGMTVITCLIAPSAQAKKKTVGEDISNMIIQGQDRLTVHGTVPEMSWEVEAYKDVHAAVRDYVLLGELKSPSISQP